MMKKILITHTGILILSVLILASCTVTHPYEQPAASTGPVYRDQTSPDTNTIASLPYTAIFNDPILQGMIREGIEQNLNLRIAYTRILQSQSRYEQSRAAFYPDLSTNASITQLRLSDGQKVGTRNTATQFLLNFSSSWEADIWGKLKSSRRASLASLLQTDAAARAIQTSIISNVANNYYTLLALDQQLLITEQTVRNWDTTVTTMRALKEAARVTEAAVVQSEAQRYAAEVTIPDLKQSIRETENALSVLIGRSPGSILRGRLDEQQPIANLQTGIPAQLLANRPDVQEAEFAFRNAFELTNVARTAFYPSISITGSAGLLSLTLTNFLSPGAFFASLGAGLAQPIYNRRLNRTNLAVAEAEQNASLYGFRNSLLVAGQEVSDALSLHETALEKMSVRTNQLTALENSVSYTQELLRNGFANYNEVIYARQSLLAAELGRVNDKLQQLQAIVNLYRALGGGWK
jgi:multidrug efflux system outer membrane protein